jgi:hypothetical protein
MKGEKLKILILEDDQGDLDGFIASAERYCDEKSRIVEVVGVKTIEKALTTLDNTFDGAIIDMSIDNDADAGNSVINEIIDLNIRIPYSILTGTPDNVHNVSENIKIHKKGEADHTEMLEDFWRVHVSGITKVMGGRGKIEELLTTVYHNNILPQREAWATYGESDPGRSEKALLRHTLNHLIQMIDLDEEVCFPEEFYILPAIDDNLRTGCIIEHEDDGRQFLLLTPLCDLTRRSNLGDDFKANSLILSPIQKLEEIYDQLPDNKKQGDKQKKLESMRNELTKNTNSNLHALPTTDIFAGGYANFEALLSIPKGEFTTKFGKPIGQISPSFLKDIVSRFSAYLGRQGQPEIHH